MFKEIKYSGEKADSPQEQVSEQTQDATVYALEGEGSLPATNPLARPQVVYIPRESIGSLRRQSVVSIAARTSVVVDEDHASIPIRRGSTWSRKASLRRQSYAQSIASIESNDTGVTIANDDPVLPTPLQDVLQAQEAGTYTMTIDDSKDEQRTEEKKTVKVTLSPLRYSVASKGYLEEYTNKFPIPSIEGNLQLAKFRHGWFTVYRRLFAVAFVANMIAITVLASRGSQTSYHQAALGVGINILAAVAARHEELINLVVGVVHYIPLSWPIAIRQRVGSIYCHGGIHSGSGASAAVWYIYFTVLLAVQNPTGSRGIRIALFTTSGVLLSSLLTMVGLSHPTFRGRYHDMWELSHRYLGWTITALIWTQVFLLSSMSRSSLGQALIHSPLFWMVIVVTLLLIYPWATMRRRKFVATQLSSHALRLEFDYRRKPNRTGDNIRLSHSPLVENHGFATIPNASGTKFSCIISNAGDWTKSMITSEDRGNKIWVRGRLFLGIIEVPMLFSPLVIVATGSGIAPCMAFIQTHPEWPVRIVWSARFPEVTYGPEIIETVLKADPDAIIIDTKETGRPDLVALMYAAYKEINAEAILCVSTVKVTEQVSFEMRARGIPIYVPIFDS